MRWPWPLMIVLTIAAVASGCGGTDAESARDEAKRKAWMKGYTEFTGGGSESDGLAYKWDNSVCDSRDSGCWGMRVVTRDGCESLWVELQVVNPEGYKVGDAMLEEVKNLGPGEVAMLDFQRYSRLGYQAVLDDIDCF